jgi:hypothetical protein
MGMPPAAPPGMLSPASLPFPPPVSPVDDAPPITPVPYLIGTGYATASGSSVLIPVTQSAGRGDAIIVYSANGATTGSSGAGAVTDTQGNVYEVASYDTTGPSAIRRGAWTSVNSAPLAAGTDTITARFPFSPGNPKVAVAVGIPAGAPAALGAPAPWPTLHPQGAAYNDNSSGALGQVAVFQGAGSAVDLVQLSNAPLIALAAGYVQGSGAAPIFPPKWTVIGQQWDNTGVAPCIVVAWTAITSLNFGSGEIAAWVRANTATLDVGITFLAFIPETRFASAPGQVLPPPSPPGFLSPAAMPFSPASPAVISDVPVPNAPYVIGQAAGAASSYTLQVQTKTSPGDAILISAAGGAGYTCTDTQGNTYAYTNSNQLVAVNPTPLGPSDSITITILSSVGRTGAVVIGIPAALAAGSFPAPDLNHNGAGGAQAITVPTPAGVAVPAGELIFAAAVFEGAAGGGVSVAQFPQGWNVVTSIADQTPGRTFPYYIAVAWKLNNAQIPAGSAVVSTVQNAGNNSNSLSYTTFMAETRFAAAPGAILPAPVPPSPPGFLSPAPYPFPPPVQPANDAPPTTPQPYLIGSTCLPSGTGTTVTIQVQNPTNAGDAIVVGATSSNNGGAPVSCTDTQGNTYSLVNSQPVSGSKAAGQWLSVNSSPLTTADTITVTFVSATSSRSAIASGVPFGAVSRGTGYLAYAGLGGQKQGSAPLTITAAGSLQQPVMLILNSVNGGDIAAGNINPPSFPQGWTVLATATSYSNANYLVTAYQLVSGVNVNAVLAAVLVTTAYSNCLQVLSLIPETRFTYASGQILPPPSPPGFLSPAALPFSPASPQVINDVPNPPGSPYLVAVSNFNITGDGTTCPIPVQNPTNRGDAIVVLVGSLGNSVQPSSCTDTQGNVYSLVGVPAAGQFEGFHAIAVNTNPLTAADTITVTWPSSVDPLAVVLGCPAGSLSASSYLVPAPAAFNTNRQSSQTFTVTSPVALSQPALLVLTLGAGSLTAAALVLQGATGYGAWNIAGFAFNGSDTQCMLAAWKIVPGLAVNQVVAAATALATANASILRFTALIPETRFAPTGPHPDLAPGLQSPGAFVYQPAPGAPFGVQYNPGIFISAKDRASFSDTAVSPDIAPVSSPDQASFTDRAASPGVAPGSPDHASFAEKTPGIAFRAAPDAVSFTEQTPDVGVQASDSAVFAEKAPAVGPHALDSASFSERTPGVGVHASDTAAFTDSHIMTSVIVPPDQAVFSDYILTPVDVRPGSSEQLVTAELAPQVFRTEIAAWQMLPPAAAAGSLLPLAWIVGTAPGPAVQVKLTPAGGGGAMASLQAPVLPVTFLAGAGGGGALLPPLVIFALPAPPQQPLGAWQKDVEGWAIAREQQVHVQALWQYGELAMFALMWTTLDFRAGFVQRCYRCWQGTLDASAQSAEAAIAAAYGQGNQYDCPVCYNTTFALPEGSTALPGIRALIIRPAMFTEFDKAQQFQARGVMQSAAIDVESTPDFRVRNGDYLFRSDGTRYRLRTPRRMTLRTGFATPWQNSAAITYNLAQAALEDPASVAYAIPPEMSRLAAILGTYTRVPVAYGWAETVNGPLIPEEAPPPAASGSPQGPVTFPLPPEGD